MRKSFGAKPCVYPMPVFIISTYDENGVPNAMNAAWGGIAEENRISICLDQTHKTTSNIGRRKAFVVSMATEDQVVGCDYVGIVSGNDVPDKFAKAGFHAERSENVDAPLIKELPLAVECRLISYDETTCLLMGEIVNVCADESILTDGRIDPRKLRPITYDTVNKKYYSFGEVVGSAFSDGNRIRKA